MLMRWSLIAALLVVLSVSGTVSAQTAAACQFRTAPGATAAFCETLAGPSAGGRAGDLDDTKWSAGRFDGVYYSGTDLMPFPLAPATSCKAGVTSVNADNDILVCDSASGHMGQFETAMSAQDYAVLSLRPRQAFDFAGRTGTITYNVDTATSTPLGWWTSLYVTEDPASGANNTGRVSGMTPRNGVGINFDGNNCQGNLGTAVRLNDVFTFSDYAETDIPVGNGVCIQTSAGKQNHLEVRLSQTHIDVWASDFSTDGGVTFPNFRLIGSAAINLTFSQGYVHFQHEQRAPKKYGFPPAASSYYWSGLGFDGPAAAQEVAYAVPDAITLDPTSINDFPNNTHNLNIGYGLFTNPNTTYTCCPQTTLGAFVLPNVNVTGLTSAKLTFAVLYVQQGGFNSSTYAIKYRFNAGAWASPTPAPEFAKALACQAWGPGECNWSMGFAFAVPVSALVQGANSLEIASDGSGNSYPTILSHVELLTFAAAGQPTPTAAPTSTLTPVPTAAPTCQVLTLVDGQQRTFTRPSSFCTDQ